MHSSAHRSPAHRHDMLLMLMALVSLVLSAGCGAGRVRVDAVGCKAIDNGISGRVVDRTSGAPIAGARVESDPETEFRSTDAQGCFYLERDFTRPEGEQEVRPATYSVGFTFEDKKVTLAGQDPDGVYDDFEIAGVKLDDTVSIGRVEVTRKPRPKTDTVVIFSPSSGSGGGSGSNKHE